MGQRGPLARSELGITVATSIVGRPCEWRHAAWRVRTSKVVVLLVIRISYRKIDAIEAPLGHKRGILILENDSNNHTTSGTGKL